ncbi:MAG: AdeC/AdeK/OprM family multidrug efflux complex outer membrane factor [Geobacteraceae bacterium]|nr:AdeC/AdeK/OprM family multidrug efflux complex outer membrane factor [Geobacteraceae bacterium]
MKLNTLPLTALALCLAGCTTMAPKYTQPAAQVPAEWSGSKGTPAEGVQPSQKTVADIRWQDFFVDKQLGTLIELALRNNRDLRVASLNIERLQALYQIRRSDLLPKVEASASANFQRIPEDFSSSGSVMTTEQYNVGLGLISYELDLFGRVRSLKDQALEQYLATEQAQRSMQISLVSQVATVYLTLAADRERLQLAKDTLAGQQESYKLTKSRFDAGVSSSLALNQARTTVDAARVDIARYTTLVAQDENALNLVVGSHVSAELLPQALSERVTAMKDIAPGLPSDVLLRRPDILQAESQLKSLNANIGAARAAFFPRITLVSSVGFGSTELSGLFTGDSFAWSILPRVSLPIFDGGTNKANLKVAEVDRDIAVAQYEKAIQTAFREVSDVLAQKATIDEQVAAQQSLADATAESYKLSQARFDKGVDSYLAVLDSQRSLYGAQQNLISTRLARLANLVALYKVLGGGDSNSR